MTKITRIGKAKIFEKDDTLLVSKEGSKDLTKLFNYLKSKGFYNYPLAYDETTYYYLDNYSFDQFTSLREYLILLASLHQKTSYKKLTDQANYEKIYQYYEDLIDYYENTFLSYLIRLEEKETNLPDELYFMSNYSYLTNSLNELKKFLEEWYQSSLKSLENRVSIIQNNVSLDHFIMNETPMLINFDHYKTDTPLIDLVSFIKKYYQDCNIVSLVNEYITINPLSTDEILLLKVMLKIPSLKKFDTKCNMNLLSLVKEITYLKRMDELLNSLK